MPRGKYVNHKGRSRNFTSPEELEEELKKNKKKANRQEDASESESEEEEESAANSESGSESEDESEEDNKKAKGVSSLIEIENPNRVQKKSAVKVAKIGGESRGDKGPKQELSRREREELEKQKAQAAYQKLHAEGKTEQARADLARLAIIKQHRAEAAARREAEKKEKEDRKKPSTANR